MKVEQEFSDIASARTDTSKLLEQALGCLQSFPMTRNEIGIEFDPVQTNRVLQSVHEFLRLAEERVGDIPLPSDYDIDRIDSDNPENWMFKLPSSSMVTMDVVATACGRAQAVIRLMSASCPSGTWPIDFNPVDQLSCIKLVEGMIDQAIAAITIGTIDADQIASAA